MGILLGDQRLYLKKQVDSQVSRDQISKCYNGKSRQFTPSIQSATTMTQFKFLPQRSL